MLFNNTIFFNIAYGKPSATPEEVYMASELASLREIVERMPKKFETLVGERGMKLSGLPPPLILEETKVFL